LHISKEHLLLAESQNERETQEIQLN